MTIEWCNKVIICVTMAEIAFYLDLILIILKIIHYDCTNLS